MTGDDGDDALTGPDRDRYPGAIAAIDAANAEDPTTMVVAGSAVPKELAHGRMMTDWVLRLDPSADELQLLAARAHHFRRWTSPRDDYPEGRAGYLRWRAAARRRHAEEVGAVLAAHGYRPEEIERVQTIIRKEGLRSDPAVQTHEDALCLVFLETQLTDVADRLGQGPTVEVLVKTMHKMSPAGLAAAGALELEPAADRLLARATAELAADQGP